MSAAPAEHPGQQAGSPWKVVLRITFAAALLALLIAKTPDFDSIFPDQHHLETALLLALAVLTGFAGIVLSAWRWQRVLLLFDRRVRLRTLTTHYFAGQFVGNALPSTIGGDVVRVARVSTTINSPTVGFASVVLERLTGFLALPLLVFFGFLLRPSLLEEKHAWIAVAVAGASLAILGLILLVAGHPRIAGRFAERENWTRFVGAVHLGVDRLRREPIQVVPILGTAMIYQLSVVCTFALIFRALDLTVPIVAVFAFIPAVAMLQVLPISFGGFGVREGALILFLHALGVSNAQAIAAGVLFYLVVLVTSLPGAPAFAVGNRGPRSVDTPAAGRRAS
jgi:glycosyltransferase 2 family protein